MRGPDLVEWRKQHGYSQEDLRHELQLGSRQTISNWENSQSVPRLVQLAITALEKVPGCRLIAGKKATAKDKRQYFRSMGRDDDREDP